MSDNALKLVAGISNGKSPRPSRTPTFFPPAPLPSLQFTLAELAGSIGRTTALSDASNALIAALTIGAEELLNALVDPSTSGLAFVADVQSLADAARTNFSGNLGAGIADLYMSSLGYSFRCNGRYLIPASSKAFDFAYDGVPTAGNGIVAAEAKGTIHQTTSAATVKGKAQDGYETQVDHYIGHPLGGAVVLHGYAIAIGGSPSSLPCYMHVQETDQSSTVDPPTTPPPPIYDHIISQARPKLIVPNTLIVLGNYRAVFRLMNAADLVSAIDVILSGQELTLSPSLAAPLSIVQWRGNKYVARTLDVNRRPLRSTVLTASFGLRLDVAISFVNGLRHLARSKSLPTLFPTELPVRETRVQNKVLHNDGGAEFSDGLAYFGPWGAAEASEGSLLPLAGFPLIDLASLHERIRTHAPPRADENLQNETVESSSLRM